jgi:hypothetical protein
MKKNTKDTERQQKVLRRRLRALWEAAKRARVPVTLPRLKCLEGPLDE